MQTVTYETMKIPTTVPVKIPTTVLVKMWTMGVPVEEEAKTQLLNTARLPFIHSHIAVMPDVHAGIGATIGSVVPTIGAIIPAAVGVDIGCGMYAAKTDLKAEDLPDDLSALRTAIEAAVPVGFCAFDQVPEYHCVHWQGLDREYKSIIDQYPALRHKTQSPLHQLGTLGGGNHFIEICLDETNTVWLMLHSGSRGVGNRIGQKFIELAKKDMENHFVHLPDQNLAYFQEGTNHFQEYIRAIAWAQVYANLNRRIMAYNVFRVLHKAVKPFSVDFEIADCHHNYVSLEIHFGKKCYVTRKGAVNAERDKWGIIPGSMGTKSFIVQGKGNPDSFNSCSHGAGRRMSRTQARAQYSVDDLEQATEGVECRKDRNVIDETPQAYKDIDQVMAAQSDLVDIRYQLKQVLCVKG